MTLMFSPRGGTAVVQSKYRSKERVFEVDGNGVRRLKYAVDAPIPEDEARRQGLVGVNVSERDRAAAQTAKQPTGDGAIRGEGRAPGDPSPAGSTKDEIEAPAERAAARTVPDPVKAAAKATPRAASTRTATKATAAKAAPATKATAAKPTKKAAATRVRTPRS